MFLRGEIHNLKTNKLVAVVEDEETNICGHYASTELISKLTGVLNPHLVFLMASTIKGRLAKIRGITIIVEIDPE